MLASTKKPEPGACKPCHKIARKKWREEHPDEWRALKRKEARRHADARNEQRRTNPEIVKRDRAANKKWRHANPEIVGALASKQRAKRKNCAGFHTAADWNAVLKAAKGVCAICGERAAKGEKLTKDHIIPLAAGGTDYSYNLQAAHLRCNVQKNAHIDAGTQHSLFENTTQLKRSMLCGRGVHVKASKGRCLACARDRRAAWVVAHPEENRQAKRASETRKKALDSEAHRLASNEKARRWREAHPGAAAAAQKRYRQKKAKAG